MQQGGTISCTAIQACASYRVTAGSAGGKGRVTGASVTAEKLLSGAGVLLRRGWCQGCDARDGDGHEVEAWYSEARSWSVLGALVASCGLDPRAAPHVPIEPLATAAAAVGVTTNAHSLQAWNDADERTKEEVLVAIDRAIMFIAEREHELDGRAADAVRRN